MPPCLLRRNGRMARGGRIAAASGLLVLAALGTGLWTIREEIAAWRRSLVVRQLFDPARRDAAWRRIVRDDLSELATRVAALEVASRRTGVMRRTITTGLAGK